MSSVPVSEMTDAAVLAFRLSRWDYQLLKSNDVPTAAYTNANVAHRQLTGANKAETRAAREADLLVQKRLLLTKLLGLRAAAGQAMNQDLRTASAAISMAKYGADKVLSDMVKETTRHSKKMLSLVAKQTERIEGIDEL